MIGDTGETHGSEASGTSGEATVAAPKWRRVLVLVCLALVVSVAAVLVLIRALRQPPVRVGSPGPSVLRGRARQGIPVLHRAAATGDVATAEMLLRRGARVDEPDRDGWTALHWAVESGDRQVVESLLIAGADPDAEALPLQSGETMSDVMDPRREERLYKRSISTPLRVALDGGWLSLAQLLIDAGADVEKRGVWEMTPLHVAAQGAPVESVEFLIANGVSIDAVDEAGWDALHWAAHGCNAETVSVLLRHEADPNRASTDKRTMWETHWTRWDYPVGTTPLHIAANGGERRAVPLPSRVPSPQRIATVRALLAGDADAAVRDADGRRPFDEPTLDWSSVLSGDGTPLNEP